MDFRGKTDPDSFPPARTHPPVFAIDMRSKSLAFATGGPSQTASLRGGRPGVFAAAISSPADMDTTSAAAPTRAGPFSLQTLGIAGAAVVFCIWAQQLTLF